MFSNRDSHIVLLPPTLSNKLGTLLISFLVLMIAVGLLQPLVAHAVQGTRNVILLSSVFQNVFAFICPAWFTAYLCSVSAGSYLGTQSRCDIRQYAGVVILMIFMMPLLNAIVDWNAHMTLGNSMSDIEMTLREWENRSARTTAILLSDSSFWGLFSGVLVIGFLTGFAEETFFRAGLQKAITSSCLNHHIGIWIAAIVFSTVHFQFFGFVPRLLLGALFGYLYWYTGSLWISAFAHALNNTGVVVSSWLMERGIINLQLDTIGVEGEYSPVWCVSSLVLTSLFICFLWRFFLRRP